MCGAAWRRGKVDHVLLCECDHRADELIGLKAGLESRSPPLSKQKNTTRTSFVQMGAAEPTKVSPQLTEGTATAAGRPEARVTREKGDRRRPEATGGDRRRPEATGGEARAKSRPF